MKAPESVEALLHRARSLAGWTVEELARRHGEEVPEELRRHKGWTGRLMERALGITAGSNEKGPDFVGLGVELKTIPVDRGGKPRESTFVCSVELAAPDEVNWEGSGARAKLMRVLFVPLLSEAGVAVGARSIGRAILWEPTGEEEALLRKDWTGHMEVIRAGWAEKIRGTDGEALQIRPKGATRESRTWGVDEGGDAVLLRPMGFYLRARFTEGILARHLRPR